MGSVASWTWLRGIRTHDLVLMLLFSALAATGPDKSPEVLILLALIALLQVLEPKIAFFRTTRGSVIANLLKLALCYPLVHKTGGQTGGVTSSYYMILLIPVMSAGSTLGVAGTALFTVLACASYLSFLLFIDWGRYTIPPDQIPELGLRLAFLALAGYLTDRLADLNRAHAQKAQEAAEQLALANQNLREAEAAVRRSERLAALGQLSAGLAHELRNPLGTIKASAEMLDKSVPQENEVAKELAGFISTEVDRTNSLVTRFLEFARPLALKPVKAELAETIDRAITQLERNRPHYDVTVYKNYSPDVAPFRFDPELLERAICNLLLNAAQATPAGGAITVKTRRVDGDVELTVIDRGTGIEPKLMESIFNPFVTTKAEGVGLGLAIVAKIVDLHRGKMAVESEPGKGSIFRIYLPREPKE
jgi:two-component system, NtrC family, sensor histidine kinase HydH